jgi:hypothetical protein
MENGKSAIARVVAELEECEVIRQALRQHAMIYQSGMKDEASEYFKRPKGFFYHWTYQRWNRARGWYLRKKYGN